MKKTKNPENLNEKDVPERLSGRETERVQVVAERGARQAARRVEKHADCDET